MAKEGKKLELYEILAAKRAKGKIPPTFEAKPLRQANSPPEEAERPDKDTTLTSGGKAVIIDDAVAEEAMASRMAEVPVPTFPSPSRRDIAITGAALRPEAPKSLDRMPAEPAAPRPDPEPRQRSPREVVFALDTAFIFFTVMLALVGCSYFLGYKRGQEERPVSLSGASDIEVTDPARLGLRNLAPAPRSAVRPSEQDFTLILRTEPVTDDLPERLEMELAEAVTRGKQASGSDIQGFIFRTSGSAPLFVLAVGLGKTANDAELNKLLQVYNRMEGVTLSREPRPYIGCRIAPVRELGTPVY